MGHDICIVIQLSDFPCELPLGIHMGSQIVKQYQTGPEIEDFVPVKANDGKLQSLVFRLDDERFAFYVRISLQSVDGLRYPHSCMPPEQTVHGPANELEGLFAREPFCGYVYLENFMVGVEDDDALAEVVEDSGDIR